jgi:hypothetical protein
LGSIANTIIPFHHTQLALLRVAFILLIRFLFFVGPLFLFLLAVNLQAIVVLKFFQRPDYWLETKGFEPFFDPL